MSGYEDMDRVFIFKPAKMRTLRLQRVGRIIYQDLDADARLDLTECIGRRLDIEPHAAEFQLDGVIIPLYSVDPRSLIGKTGRQVRVADVESYGAMLAENLESLPPVVIDSSRREYPLCEGGHRTVAAIDRGLAQILAVDVADFSLHRGRLRVRR